ncbi:MAG: cyclase family protein [Dehalococcoidia bacterium]|nr:cyclase family protein [Dehalococcoidia bacterium]
MQKTTKGKSRQNAKAVAPQSRRATPRIPSEAEARGYLKDLSNWGRWGKEDTLGTLNLISPKKRVDASRLVKEGTTVSLARQIKKETAPDITTPFQHFMTGTGESFANKKTPPGSMQGAGDFYGIAYHGYYYTHLDAHSHVFSDGKLYNGMPAEMVTSRGGAGAGSVEAAHSGVVTRGVLLDVPKIRGIKWLEPGQGVFPEDLEAAEKAAGVRVSEGDALLVRVGHWKRRTELGPWPLTQGWAGLHGACLPWLRERGVALIGSDSANDVVPSGYPGFSRPIHETGIAKMGLWLLDDCDFEELVATCERLRRWEFLFSLAPLRVVNGTGSPVNPLAIF